MSEKMQGLIGRLSQIPFFFSPITYFGKIIGLRRKGHYTPMSQTLSPLATALFIPQILLTPT